MSIRNQKDFWAGVMFVIFGVLYIIWSRDYQFGTTQRMGPGYFPTVLGYLLTFFGLLVGLPALKRNAEVTHVGGIGWRGLFVILSSVALYAFLLPTMGFVVSLIVLIIISAFASTDFRFFETVISTIVLGIMSYLVFVKGLALQFPVWPVFLTR